MNANQHQLPSSDERGTGRLIFHVSTAGGAIPLEGARIILRQKGAEGDPRRGDALAVMYSDRNGRTKALSLQTMPRNASLSPRNGTSPPPFLCYDAEVTLEGYRGLQLVCIPIFDGVTSVQPADMIPLPENGREDGSGYGDVTVIEGENPYL